MASLDGFIVLVAVPAIQADLHVTGAAIQLIVVGHGLTYAIGLITGRLVQGIGSALMYPQIFAMIWRGRVVRAAGRRTSAANAAFGSAIKADSLWDRSGMRLSGQQLRISRLRVCIPLSRLAIVGGGAGRRHV